LPGSQTGLWNSITESGAKLLRGHAKCIKKRERKWKGKRKRGVGKEREGEVGADESVEESSL